MRAIVIPRYGTASVLEVRDLPDPIPREREVRIAVRAAGLNFSAASARQGLYPEAPPNPAVVGYEVAGTVEALGPQATGFALGDRVWALCRFGGHAELVCTPTMLVRHLSPTLGFEEAAAIPVVYATARLLVTDYGHVRPHDRVLIHMAAGGVGLAALQLCRQIPNVTVFGTASAAKHDSLRAHGLDHPIDYRTLDFESEVRRLTGGEGVDVILDPMGGGHWKKNYRLLAPLGRLVVFGLANATRPGTRSLLKAAAQLVQAPRWSPLTLMNDNRAVMGLNLGNLFDRPRLIQAGLGSLAQGIEDRIIRPALDRVYAFSDAAAAHLRIEERLNVGKVVLVPHLGAGS